MSCGPCFCFWSIARRLTTHDNYSTAANPSPFFVCRSYSYDKVRALYMRRGRELGFWEFDASDEQRIPYGERPARFGACLPVSARAPRECT